MINKKVLIGFIIGIIITFIGIAIYTIFIGLQLDLDTNDILDKITSTAVLGKRASIGVLLNIPIFYLFLNKKKEEHAKGIIVAIVFVAIIFIVNKL